MVFEQMLIITQLLNVKIGDDLTAPAGPPGAEGFTLRYYVVESLDI